VAVIKLQEISKIYGFGESTALALDEINLEIEHGEFLAIMGPSGSGKSTLMNIIGLLDHPTHGMYNLDNRSVAKLRQVQRARARRDKIGFVFQSSNLLPRMHVLDNVALPLSYKGMSLAKRLRQASDVLERVGMRDREYYFPKQLSGGQLQRAAIARALVNNPSIIIADEPTGNLDSANSLTVMELLSDINRQGNTVLMVTHNPELTRYASRVIYMRDGQIVEDEETAIGQIAKGAKTGEHLVDPEDDIVAGVSAMMRDIPAKELKTGQKKKPKKTRKTAKKSSKNKPKQSRAKRSTK
jgi:putative ABC transport system ATP-binding protein